MINNGINTEQNHITRLACSIGGLSNFTAFPNQTFLLLIRRSFTPRRCVTLMADLFPSKVTVNLRSVNVQKIKLHCALFCPPIIVTSIVFCNQ